MPLSPTATRDVLASLGHHPKRSLGQNFLVDGNIVHKSVSLAGVAPGDTVIEIGPGLGTLTDALLTAGATVYAIERDERLYAHLTETLLPQYPERLHLLFGDAVEHPLAAFNPATDPSAPSATTFKIVANLPYAIATPWLDGILTGPLPATLVLMLQQEAAQRYAASPGSKSFGAISIFLQAAYAIAPGHKVPAACFHPRPDVESYLLHLVRRPAPFTFDRPTKSVIRGCFQQRRKQIGSLLRHLVPPPIAAAWLEHLRSVGLSALSRPEDIPVSAWQHLVVPPATAA
jgi:16S rRNA (adenine1518-N6/adenine1519-N6)-dimethyltransferase